MRQLARLLTITYVLLKYGFLKFIGITPLPRGEAFQKALVDLGPIFVKFGQLLSVRGDLLPEDIVLSLTKLQDDVPPFDGALAIKMIEKSFQQPINSLYATFDSTPIASASIAQVHAATLLDGQEVVVKVLRPKIKKHIQRDVALLETLAKLVNRFCPAIRRFRPIEVVNELKSTLYDELDLTKEAANASQLRRNFQNKHILQVPKIYWDQTKKDVLVTQHMHGVSISDIEALKNQKVNLKLLAERGVEIFFTQFQDCFFHADMHPGNIFVDIQNPADPKYIAVDFGIMGTLTPADQQYIAQSLLAFFNRDYRRVAMVHIQSGWVPPTTKVAALESAIRAVCEPIFEKPFQEISFAKTLLRLFQTAKQFDMTVQPQLLLLQKTLLGIEGLGRQLYPELDLWQTAKPFLETWIKDKMGPKAILQNLTQNLPTWLNTLPKLPEAIMNMSSHHHNIEKMNLSPLHHPSPTPAPPPQHLGRKLTGVGLMICATLLFIHTNPHQWFTQYGTWLAGLGSLLGLGLLFI